jgi:WhiB family redox-sensing transcriptional regulator
MRYVEMPGGSVNGTGQGTAWSEAALITMPEPWTQDALCAEVGGDAWFPERSSAQSSDLRDARALCGRCPVAAECLAYALRNREQFGVWGGKTPNQRSRMLKRAGESS